MKKKIEKSKMAVTSGLLFYSYISAAICFLEKKFSSKKYSKLQGSKEKINEKIQDGGHFRFSCVLETMRLREKLFKQKVTQMTRYE
jgi:hypothetical protein